MACRLNDDVLKGNVAVKTNNMKEMMLILDAWLVKVKCNTESQHEILQKAMIEIAYVNIENDKLVVMIVDGKMDFVSKDENVLPTITVSEAVIYDKKDSVKNMRKQTKKILKQVKQQKDSNSEEMADYSFYETVETIIGTSEKMIGCKLSFVETNGEWFYEPVTDDNYRKLSMDDVNVIAITLNTLKELSDVRDR